MKTIFYGWRVVAGAFVVALFGWGIGFYAPSVYLQATIDKHGWPIGLVSAAITFHFALGALAVAQLPRLHKRFGVARVTLAGAVSLAIGVIAWAHAEVPWHVFAAATLTGIGWVAMGAAGVNAIVSPWFERRRPAALSTAYNGASVGGTLFTPIWVAAIAAFGFAAASIGIGIAMVAIIAVLAATVLRATPEAMGLRPDGDDAAQAAQAAQRTAPARIESFRQDRAFVTLAAGMALGLFAQIGLIAHLYSLLVPALGPRIAAYAAALSTVCAILGRTAMGWLMTPGTDRRVAAAANYAMQCLGCVAFLLAGTDGIVWLFAGVMLVGLGIGNTTSLPPLIAQMEFAKADVPKAVALSVAIGQGTYAFAPFAFGLLRETSAAWSVFAVAIAIYLIAAGCYLAGRASAPKRGRA
ncbi:MAG: MFS transporter [Alphaproteobacteria bacterium]|nr:MFS transporter [Alphaproteobacteria bacterium]